MDHITSAVLTPQDIHSSSVGALNHSSNMPHPQQITPEFPSPTLRCVIRAFSQGLSSSPSSKDKFYKMEKQSSGTLLFLLPPRWGSQTDGGISLPSWAVPQKGTKCEVLFYPQPFLLAEASHKNYIHPTQ